MHEPNVHTHTLAPLERTTHKARMFTQHMDHIHTKHVHTHTQTHTRAMATHDLAGVAFRIRIAERKDWLRRVDCSYTQRNRIHMLSTQTLSPATSLNWPSPPHMHLPMDERERTDSTAHARTLVLLWYVCTKKDVKKGRPALVVISVKR